MKFGKRLAAEASRRWSSSYIDYKLLKKFLGEDAEAGTGGQHFLEALRQELEKVSTFYLGKESELEAVFDRIRQLYETRGMRHPGFHQFLSELNDLKKFVVLNYIAVVKALKKRNKQYKDEAQLDVLECLKGQPFFTSTRLASLSNHADILSKELMPQTDPQEILDDLMCSICLGVLHEPVILTCAHRFCWGCIVAHCASRLMRNQERIGDGAAPQPGAVGMAPGTGSLSGGGRAEHAGANGHGGADEAPSHHHNHAHHAHAAAPGEQAKAQPAGSRVDTFECPVCRKPQILDADNLKVDAGLQKFVERQLQTLSMGQGTPEVPPSATVADSVRDALLTSHSDIIETLKDCIIPHPSHWLAEVQAADDEEMSKEKPQGAPPTAARRDAVATAVVTQATTPRKSVAAGDGAEMAGDNQADGIAAPFLGPPVVVTESLKQQGLHGPACTPEEEQQQQLRQQQILAQQQQAKLTRRRTLQARQSGNASPLPAPGASGAPLLPPQPDHLKGRLTIVLDLDGTLVSTYTIKRAPRLPQQLVKSYVVGVGGPLNVNGVFVVERPGLGEFLRAISEFAEVVLFTAGLEDYARPIVEALDPEGKIFFAKLYRPATLESVHYPCVKDMSRLGRDMRRVVLVDDTPLAFLHQPHNGVPVFTFKADPDDRLLGEAILPLLWNLSKQEDVRPVLRRRFQMDRWFQRNGFGLPMHQQLEGAGAGGLAEPRQSAPVTAAATDNDVVMQESSVSVATVAGVLPGASPTQSAEAPESAQQQDSFARGLSPPVQGTASWQHNGGSDLGSVPAQEPDVLLVLDYDHTILDFDSLEQIITALSPDVLPMWNAIHQPQNFVPMTNACFGALQRRGVSEETILSTIRSLAAANFPKESAALLRFAGTLPGVRVVILSDCNDLVIRTMLGAVGCGDSVHEIVTNQAQFTRGPGAIAQGDEATPGPGPLSHTPEGALAAASRMVVYPRHPWSKPPHGCPYCPANLCKGFELQQMRGDREYRSIIYCGDGANDLCPALRLGGSDYVLARRGFMLEKLLAQILEAAQSMHTSSSLTPPVLPAAHLSSWRDHGDLLDQVRQILTANASPTATPRAGSPTTTSPAVAPIVLA